MPRAKPPPNEHVKTHVAMWSPITHTSYFIHYPFFINLQHHFHICTLCWCFASYSTQKMKAIRRALNFHKPLLPATSTPSCISAHIAAFPQWTGCAPIWSQPLSSCLLKFIALGTFPSLLHSKISLLYWIIPISTQTCWIFSILLD